MDAKQKFFLFKQSANFCAAPWTNLYLEANGNVLTCCVARTVLGNIRTDRLEDILAGHVASGIRESLLKDAPHDNCVVCQNLNSEHNQWMRGHYNELAKSAPVDYEDTSSFVLNSVDLRWSNTCNFKCVYCEPKYSSGIEREQRIVFSNGDNGNTGILEFALANQKNIKEIYMAGGEPLLMKENRLFLEQYTNFDTKLRINTNLSNINEKNSILTLIKQFKDITWTISVDNTADRFEYTRNGGNWQQFLTNVETIRQLGHTVRFNMVYFVGNAITFADDFNFLKDLVPGCEFSAAPVIGHEAISVRNLSIELKSQAKNNLNKLLEGLAINSSLCNNISNCIKELNEEPNGLSYAEYFNNLDSKRNTDWRIVFPELV